MNTVYKKMYLTLFNAITDALSLLPDDPEKAVQLLKSAQVSCEDMYIDSGEDV